MFGVSNFVMIYKHMEKINTPELGRLEGLGFGLPSQSQGAGFMKHT